ncbi:hypothetical protein Y032_0825g2548 [Ancylostoma ceylanicum]|nr:hypothetical protein Y032_0825g2548 [Ancylostoma ceylanicum]
MSLLFIRKSAADHVDVMDFEEHRFAKRGKLVLDFARNWAQGKRVSVQYKVSREDFVVDTHKGSARG